MIRLSCIALLLATAACSGGDGAVMAEGQSIDDAKAELIAAAETIVIGTKDGQKIYASHVPVRHARATIVLFHQADSSSYEYAGIVPHLNAAGYSTLAVDQRSGGNLYGPNRTVAKAGRSADNYIDALPDLEASLNWARLQGQPVILWGSSYSAGLIFKIAADNPTLVRALLAFSPGEYFGDQHLVRNAAAKVDVPVFITQAKSADEEAMSKSIFDAVAAQRKIYFQPNVGGIHGSSTLRSDRNAAGSAENWTAVMTFLNSLGLKPS